MTISDPGRGLVRRLGVTAAALLAFAAASHQRAEALSLASPGTAAMAAAAAAAAVSVVVEAAVFAAAAVVVSTAAAFTAADSEAAAPRSMAVGSEAVALRSIVAAFAPRRSSVAAACATAIATSITDRISTTGIISIAGSTRRATTTRILMATGIATAG